MEPPSNLPDFKALATHIAAGTGKPVEDPLDRFLGHLHVSSVPVHKRAADRLSVKDSRPKAIHRDLIRIFGTVDRVRIVTTNLDPHFGSAAYKLFGQIPDLYRAPASRAETISAGSCMCTERTRIPPILYSRMKALARPT
jgi:hypothetical protein